MGAPHDANCERAQLAAQKARAEHEEYDEKQAAYDTAVRAAEEADGLGGIWQQRTQEQMELREADLKKASKAMQKADAADAVADASEGEARQRLEEARQDQEEKQAAVTKMTELLQRTQQESAEKVVEVERCNAAVAAANEALEKAKQQHEVCAATPWAGVLAC